MAERAKYEKWLVDLEAKRASKSAKAYEKVKADYTARLEAVQEKLSKHHSAMQEHATALETRIRELESAEEEMTDALAEAELRSDVGELSEAEWETLSKKTEKELAKIRAEQASATAELEQVQTILAGTPASSEAIPSDEPEEDDSESEPETEPEAEPEPDTEPQAEAEAPSEKPKDMDELEFLKSVVGTTPSGAFPKTAPTPKPKGESAAPAAEADPKAAPRPKPSLVEAPKQPEKLVSRSEEKVAQQVTEANPITLQPKASVVQQKTLKCAECGTPNYPNEWYCERCGAELTNI